MKLIYFVSLVFSSCFCNAQTGNGNFKTSKDDNTLLWEISGNGLTKPGYLFGTFHLLCADDLQFSTTLKKALANSSEVYLELNLGDPAVFTEALMLMNMKAGKKLKDLYTPEAYKRVSDYFKDSLGTPIMLFQSMKPAFLMALLYPKMLPCSNTTSVDEAILNLARTNSIPVKGLESMAFQASVFDNISYENQAHELLQAIDSIVKFKIQFGQMISAYKEQQLYKIDEIMNDPVYGIKEDRENLLDNRNENWVTQLKEIMKKGSVFTAVGAGHLMGKNGLIALLREEGYTVRGLDNNQ